MIDLINKALPNTVSVGGKVFSIYTDFRVWMRFCQEYETWDKTGVFDFTYLFKNEIPEFEIEADYNAIFDFAYPKNVIPRGESSDLRTLDYVIDSDYIYAAFIQQYGIDLMDIEEFHWHKFRALLNSLCDTTKLTEIMGYRCYDESSEKNQQEMYRKLRSSWELPQTETAEEKEMEDKFNEMFG